MAHLVKTFKNLFIKQKSMHTYLINDYFKKILGAVCLLARIVGKKTTVTFEVLSNDEDTEKLLQQVISETITPLLNKNNKRLKAILKLPDKPETKSKPTSTKEKYSKKNLEKPELIPLGGKWAYSVALVRDWNNNTCVRIAKGQIRGNFYRDKESGEMVLTPDDPMNPISLVNKINIKRFSEWDKLQKLVLIRLHALEQQMD